MQVRTGDSGNARAVAGSVQMKFDEPKPSLRRSLIAGTAWMVAARWGIRLIGMISTVVLARLLSPADFGLVAMAMIVVGATEVLFAYGVDTALIQNPDAGNEHFDTAWTIGIIQSLLVSGLLLAVAPLAAAYFKEPRVVQVLRILCLAVLVRGLNNIGVVHFRKELRFAKEFQFMIVGKLLAFTATVSLALWLRSFWALVIGQVIGSLLGCLQSYVMHPYRPSLGLKVVRELWSFSQWMLVVNIATYLLGRADEIVVGGQGSGSNMGLYSVASEVAELPSTELAYPLARALLPGYAMLKNDAERLNRAFLNVLGFISAVTVPAALGMAMLARYIVPIVLGPKWVASIPLMQFLAVFATMRAVYGSAGNLLVVLGRTRLLAGLTVLQLVILSGAAVAGMSVGGVTGVAVAKLPAGLIFFLALFYALTRVSTITAREIASRILRPALATIAMSGILALYLSVAPANRYWALAIGVSIGIAVYASALHLLWRLSGRPNGVESILLDLASKRLSRALGT